MTEDAHGPPGELVRPEISALPEGRVSQLIASWQVGNPDASLIPGATALPANLQVGKQDGSLIPCATTLSAETKSVEQDASVEIPSLLTAPLPHKRLSKCSTLMMRALDDSCCLSQYAREDSLREYDRSARGDKRGSFRMLTPEEMAKLLQDGNLDHSSHKNTAVASVCSASTALAPVQHSRACNMFGVGILGGATGALAGVTAGAVLGVPSVLLTLGLSVPICSTAGAAAGFGAGCIAGATAGFNGTSITVVYKTQHALASACEWDNSGGDSRLAVRVHFKNTEQGPNSCSRGHAITLVSAVGGSVIMGSLGGASGTALGGVVGTTIGLIQAPFTMGLSIPVSATIGTSMGFLTGTLAGASAGFLGGGITGKVLGQCCKS